MQLFKGRVIAVEYQLLILHKAPFLIDYKKW